MTDFYFNIFYNVTYSCDDKLDFNYIKLHYKIH